MNRVLLFIALSAIMVFACQKTINWDLATNAVASMAKDSSDNCLSISVYGNYRADSVLTDSNYIVLKVVVDSPGNYSMYTSIVNGYSFTASGNFTKTGFNDVRLVGTGTPQLPQLDSFTVFLDSSSCAFIVNVLP